MLLGVHCSIRDGIHNAFCEAASLGIDTFQIFTRNQRQWEGKSLDMEKKLLFLDKRKNANIKVMFSHASYLINLASSDEIIWERSVKALIGEVQRCEDLGLRFTVVHPGSAKNTSKQKGIKNTIKALKTVLSATKEASGKILLENTAGQGSSIGCRFEDLRQIIDGVGSAKIGICFDTCHAFSAGYDIRTEKGFEEVMEKLNDIVGPNTLHVIHVNDSKGGLGSNIDRHEHIGRGKIGLEPFIHIMSVYQHIPKVIETPKEGNMDAINLATLREFAKMRM